MNFICKKKHIQKKKDHSFKNAFVHHCLLNLMLYDWELLSLSELCPLLLHRMTFYHTASFRQVLIILCSVVTSIVVWGMVFSVRVELHVDRYFWVIFPLWMLTGTKIIHVYVYILPCTTSCSLQDEDFRGFVKKFNRCSFIVIYFSNFFFFIVCIYVLRSQWNCISFEFAKFWEY